MLSEAAIRQRVASSQIVICYTCLPSDSGGYSVCEDPVSASESGSVAQRVFDRLLVRSRLGITLGPLVRPLGPIRVPRRQRFGNHSRIVDLRSCPEGWYLPAGESAVTYTNEWFKLSADTAGIVLPRVSNYSNGLFVVPTYVDPGWEGLLKIQIVNASDRPMRCVIGQDVARLLFFECIGPAEAEARPKDNPMHFGYSWQRILGDAVDPFMQSEPPAAPRSLTRMRRAASEYIGWAATAGLVALLFGAFPPVIALYQRLDDLKALQGKLLTAENTLAEIEKSVPYSGRETFTVESRRDEQVYKISLRQGTLLRPGYPLVQVEEPRAGATATAEVTRDSDEYAIVVTIRLAEPAEKPLPVTLRWAVVP